LRPGRGASVVVGAGSGPVAFARRPAPLVGESPGPRRRRRPRGHSRCLDPEPVRQTRRQPLEGQLSVAHLGAFVARRRPYRRSEPLEEAGPLARAQGLRRRHVERHLGPGARLVGVLAAGAARGEAPLKLVGGDDQAPRHPQGARLLRRLVRGRARRQRGSRGSRRLRSRSGRGRRRRASEGGRNPSRRRPGCRSRGCRRARG
jgi:hypothetical protein